MEEWQVPLWDAINHYVTTCGGDPAKHAYGNTPRQRAVADVNRVMRCAVAKIESLYKRLEETHPNYKLIAKHNEVVDRLNAEIARLRSAVGAANQETE